MSYSEVRQLPIRYRRWFIERLLKHFDDKKKIQENGSIDDSSKFNSKNLEKFQDIIDKKILLVLSNQRVFIIKYF